MNISNDMYFMFISVYYMYYFKSHVLRYMFILFVFLEEFALTSCAVHSNSHVYKCLQHEFHSLLT